MVWVLWAFIIENSIFLAALTLITVCFSTCFAKSGLLSIVTPKYFAEFIRFIFVFQILSLFEKFSDFFQRVIAVGFCRIYCDFPLSEPRSVRPIYFFTKLVSKLLLLLLLDAQNHVLSTVLRSRVVARHFCRLHIFRDGGGQA